ncbi:Fe-S cluster biogenesis protein NfuA, 4Fe-4S-binding domain [Reichenbachiella faecimaris]|uniref:Fe-S cluster biogenesis protein NfuA, 4Fe-4S-binding domain n=1 Tax=Reichenbachiella faecimaris TaxID=692418 RepID=A0A1W2G5T3_REIFA|nr:NifU family protein [Reichenbachiella faecimaris]SMD32025.1 Fe-S cluster biogenesis protein NfuA, 4Fe-4S-binding domain [Reichenbachiella faecimaris]
MDADKKQELLARIDQAINNIRPYLEADGGDVKLVDIDDDYVVKVELLGACEACPMSPMTMKAGIEEAIKRVAPEVKAINAINIAPVS